MKTNLQQIINFIKYFKLIFNFNKLHTLNTFTDVLMKII